MKTLTLDTKDGFVMTMEYPDIYEYDRGWPNGNSFKETDILNFGWLVGPSDKENDVLREFGFHYQEVGEGLYNKQFEQFLERSLKNSRLKDNLHIQEEKKFGDYIGYIHQDFDNELRLYIPLTESRFIEGVYFLGNHAKAEDYKKLYESDEFNQMINSIKITKQS